jgi:hypothetical protein
VEWDDEPSGLSVNVAGEIETGSSADIMAWYHAARSEIMRDRSLTKEQRAGKKAALKAQRALKMAARKSDRTAKRLRQTKRIKPKKLGAGSA